MKRLAPDRSLDKLMEALDRELALPLPGRAGVADEETAREEMRQFEKAKAAFQGG